jgi:hypothetical protein
MKKLFTLGVLFVAGAAFAQTENVGIGTTQPDKSAILDLSSSNKGFLLPRMSKSQRLSIVKPAQGLQVFQTDEKSGLYIFNGNDWTNAANSVAAATDPWLRGGNPVVAGEFIGSTNNMPLEFRVGGSRAGLLSADNRTFYGLLAGLNTSAIHNSGFGFRVLQANTTGTKNTGLGSQALFTNTTGNNNTAVGVYSLLRNSTGNDNAGFGVGALQNNSTGGQNMGIGSAALFSNTTGTSNSAIGYGSLYLNTTGSNNIGIGAYSLMNGTTVTNNVAIGSQAGRDVTGSNNVFIGYEAAKSQTSINNKLYVANSPTDLPLMYGDFSAKFISIGDVGVAGDATATLIKRNNLAAQYGLLVQKGILTEKLKVATMTTSDWADYVFETEYKSKMMSLEEIEKYTLKNKHLPNVPSAEEMVSIGLDYTQTSKMFMEKIEELTLYIIDLNKEINFLKAKINKQ